MTLTTISIPEAELHHALRVCMPAVSRDETRYYLQGVALSIYHDRPCAVATDGQRLHLAFLDVEMSAWRALLGEDASIILPSPYVAIMLAYTRKKRLGGAINLTRDGAHFSFGGELTFDLIDGTFPDFKRAIPPYTAADLIFHATREGSKQLVDIGRIRPGKGGGTVAPARYSVRKDTLSVAATLRTNSDAEVMLTTRVPLASSGRCDTTFSAQIALVADAVEAMGGGSVMCWQGQPDDPFCLRSGYATAPEAGGTAADFTIHTGHDALAVVMPCRL